MRQTWDLKRVVIGADMAEDRVNIVKTETDGAQQDGVWAVWKQAVHLSVVRLF